MIKMEKKDLKKQSENNHALPFQNKNLKYQKKWKRENTKKDE